MKKPSKESVMGFVSATRAGREHYEISPNPPRTVKTFSVTPQQAALYGKITEENGFSMEAALTRLEKSKASKASN